MTQVLVLNQDYRAISICDPYRAIVLILMRKAELISDISDRKIRSVRKEFAFPSIIRLYKYVQIPFQSVALTRHNIYQRDEFKCVYCGSTQHLTLDHVIPKSRGGRSSWKNLVTACQSCNARKGNQKLEATNMKMIHPPFRPSFIMYLSRFAGIVQDD